MRVFQPAAIALAAGASFVARGFCGDPNGLARILVEAIRHPGFSFVQALSPCPTFVPEQMEWKKRVRDEVEEPAPDAIEASRRIQADDGFTTGIFFAERRPTWPGDSPAASGSLESMREEFAL